MCLALGVWRALGSSAPCDNQRSLACWPRLASHTRAGAFAEESVASRFVRVFGHRERVCLLAYKAASSELGRAGGWNCGTRAISEVLRWNVFQGLSGAAGTRVKPIYNRVMAKKTKAKAPAKKPSAAKAKATKSSGGAVVEVEACKRSASGVLL